AFRQLRTVSGERGTDTVSSFLGHGLRGGRLVVVCTALITIAFLGSYAAAQLVAGSKALSSIFGWDYQLGVIIGAVIVVLYCFSGGIRASIWTDAVQAVVMMGALVMLLATALVVGGGPGAMWAELARIDPTLTALSPGDKPWGIVAFILGWVAAGFGVIGQPHIAVRAMAIDSPKNVALARNLKIACGLLNSFAAIGIGLAARVLLPGLSEQGDIELALPNLSLELLPGVLVGLILAGLFSATISTADSQILSCSAALVQDTTQRLAGSYRAAKLGTLTVLVIVLVIALSGTDNVFDLVTFSWSALASSLGPLALIRAWRWPVSTPVALAMIAAGLSVALVWRVALGLSGALYEVLPGMAAGMLVYAVARAALPRPDGDQSGTTPA
ncbi:MAG: sodium/proline symporter, partial [Myxococcota bacterium]